MPGSTNGLITGKGEALSPDDVTEPAKPPDDDVVGYAMAMTGGDGWWYDTAVAAAAM